MIYYIFKLELSIFDYINNIFNKKKFNQKYEFFINESFITCNVIIKKLKRNRLLRKKNSVDKIVANVNVNIKNVGKIIINIIKTMNSNFEEIKKLNFNFNEIL